jgi:threonine dehydrogenase-like Zn-dependent dehydrogenase
MNPIGKRASGVLLLGPQKLICSRSPFLLQILVKVLAVGVCHSDAAVQQGLFGNGFPIVPGHEIIGNVAAVPESEKLWKEGDRVGGPWHGGHDGECPAEYLLSLYVESALTSIYIRC